MVDTIVRRFRFLVEAFDSCWSAGLASRHQVVIKFLWCFVEIKIQDYKGTNHKGSIVSILFELIEISLILFCFCFVFVTRLFLFPF